MEMFKIPIRNVWVGAVAGVAIALASAGSGLAQQDSGRDPDRQTSDQSDQDRDSQRDEQAQQREQQRREQQRTRQQRDEQYQQQSEQSQWDDRQGRQWSGQESSTWPEPNRAQYGEQQTQYQYDRDRQSSQSGSRDEQDAGLGVTVIGSQDRGVIVTRIFRGTPADQMGLRNGDRITQLNGQEIRSVSEFINRIRNMNPGDEVELEVMRDRGEQTIRGELETREEALLLSSRRQGGQQWQGDPSWQAGYQESGRYGGDVSSRLISIEQQVSRLSRELEQIRFALQDLRQSGRFQQFGRTRESQAGYDEYQGGIQTERYGARQPSRPLDRFQDRGTYREYDSGQGQRSFRSDTRGSDSPGGVTGELRTRPDNDQNWENR
jgi:hypothetical protein